MKRLPTLLVLLTLAVAFCFHTSTPAWSPDSRVQGGDQVAKLQGEVQNLKQLIPDQAAVMSHLAYHWSNLWFALEKENWPLADFYLSETRSNLKWAVRVKPIRKDSAGRDFDLSVQAQGLENTQFSDLKKAIDARDKARGEAIYRETLTICYSCHKSAGKPYLRPQVPSSPEVPVINFDPNADWPK